MLIADLNFYHDSRWTTNGIKIGTLLFLYKAEGSVVGFIPNKEIQAARAGVLDPVLVNILAQPGPYLSMLGATMPHVSEESLADVVSQGLPSNLRMTEPKTWPPQRFPELLFSAAHEAQHIDSYVVADPTPA